MVKLSVNALIVAASIPAVVFGTTFTVTVGLDQNTGQVGLGFDPNRILPAVGDEIVFSWTIPAYIENPQTGSYSVTQGRASAPCQPLSGGFDSGAKPTVAEAVGNTPALTFPVTSTEPLYFYSSVDGQCQAGMALGVNTPAVGAGSIDAYINTATGGAGATSSNSSSSASASSTSASASSASVASVSSSVSLQSSVSSRAASASSSAASASASAQNNGAKRYTSDTSGVLVGLVMGVVGIFM